MVARMRHLERELLVANRLARLPEFDARLMAAGLLFPGPPLWGVTRVSTDKRFYQPDPDGQPAVIAPAYENRSLADLVAISLRGGHAMRLRRGEVAFLGADNVLAAYEWREPLLLFENGLSWIRNGCAGAVIVDYVPRRSSPPCRRSPARPPTSQPVSAAPSSGRSRFPIFTSANRRRPVMQPDRLAPPPGYVPYEPAVHDNPWPEIDRSLLDDARRIVPPFPLHLLPDPWACWVSETAQAAGTPADYVAQGLFASVAAVCGAGVQARVTSSWHESLVLWQALVGSPSSGKSRPCPPHAASSRTSRT